MAYPPRKTRRSDDPFVSIFMIGLLVVVAGGGLWYATREKPGDGNRMPRFDPEARSQSARASADGTGFVDAFKQLPNDATALQKAADEEFDNAARLLPADELARVQKIMSRKGSRDDFSDSDLAMLRQYGFGKWVRAQAVRWSQGDRSFQTAAHAIWERSPRARDSGDVTELAARWGEMDTAARQRLLGIIGAVEGKSRNLTDGERDAVISFAGEDYYANRP